MQKLLVAVHDEIVRSQLCARLRDCFEVRETGNAQQALTMALEHSPDGVVVDLGMPKMAALELCQALRDLSFTARIPIFALVERSRSASYSSEKLGITSLFEKPVDMEEIKNRLTYELETQRPQRRAHVRLRMRTILKLAGTDATGKHFDELTATENVSAGGFLCNSTTLLKENSVVEVFLVSNGERRVGRARLARKEDFVGQWRRYGFEFEEKSSEWVVQE